MASGWLAEGSVLRLQASRMMDSDALPLVSSRGRQSARQDDQAGDGCDRDRAAMDLCLPGRIAHCQSLAIELYFEPVEDDLAGKESVEVHEIVV